MASLTLALHGENVDRAFWGIGSGGVGQSLHTDHLQAIFWGVPHLSGHEHLLCGRGSRVNKL